jgi:hypothetical protein
MIRDNEQTEKTSEPEPDQMKELKPEDLYKCFWLLLNTVGGSISISAAHIENLPEDAPIKITYNKSLAMWDFKIPGKPRKRGIIKPGKKLILPEL